MKVIERGQTELVDGHLVIKGWRFDAEGGPVDMGEIQRLVSGPREGADALFPVSETHRTTEGK